MADLLDLSFAASGVLTVQPPVLLCEPAGAAWAPLLAIGFVLLYLVVLRW
jgi:hypothetical protein